MKDYADKTDYLVRAVCVWETMFCAVLMLIVFVVTL